MLSKIYLSCLFLSFCFLGLTQNTLNGKVVDQKNDPIFFATVGLYQKSDSLLAKAVSTEEDGRFNITKIKDGEYYLIVNLLGYENYSIESLSFPRQNNTVLDITLSENAQLIEGVEIRSRVPLLEQKSDRLVVNVANNVTSLNSSLLDVMKQVPGIIVTGDKLRMAGQSNVTILINGKNTRYMDMESLLRDMPGDNIQKVEVIHQPGAEFEASGTGPIINIILKKNTLYGTNGSVTLGGARGRNWKYKGGVNMSHYAGKLNIQGGLGYRNSPYWEQLTINRTVQGDVYDQVATDPNFSRTFRGNLSLDYDISDRHRIGISSRYRLNNRDNISDNITLINFQSEEQDDLELVTKNNQKRGWYLITANPYYTFEIDTSGQKLELDYNYAQFGRDGLNTLQNTVTGSDVVFTDQQFNQIGLTHIMAAKMDYTKPFSNELSISAGAKYSIADLDNDFQAFNENTDGDFVKDMNQSNQFLFTEEILGVYAKADWKLEKWSGTIGLRYEDSYSEGRSVQVDTVLNREIRQLFPSFSIGREVYGPLKATIAYSYRIDRPRYSTLNPFRFYLDPFTFQRGNPMLQPALTHSTKFNLAYEGQPFFNIEYKQTKDAMVEVLEQNDATGQTNQVTLNLDQFRVFNTSLFFPLDFIPKVSGYGGAIVNYSVFDSQLKDIQLIRNRWTVTAFLSAEFTLPWDINAEISGWYNSGELDGVITGEWLYGTEIGFSKKILNDKGRISIGAENLLYRPFYGNVNYSTLDVAIISDWDSPVVSAQFSYKFGNQSMKNKKRAGGAGNDIIRRAEN